MLDYRGLSAVSAVLATGSFERAADALGLTASAVSQRVRQLEARMGTTLIVRGQPCTATEAGARLRRHAEEVRLLEQRLRVDFGEVAPATLRLAVNADSLITWFIPVMADCAPLLFDIIIDDQDHTADRLLRGEVSGAITASERPVQGCDIRPLGALRYRAVASPDFMAHWFPNGVDVAGLSRAPALTYDAKDRLQTRWAEAATGAKPAMPTHWLPSTRGFTDAALAGVGWGLNPEALVRHHIEAGRLVELIEETPLDVPLFWQWPRRLTTALAPVTEAIRAAAKEHLSRPPRNPQATR
ncbi:LysR family transcriptional regulator ArgP [Pontivivens ytuae]|uniref:LysR family transcriptional regulator ArgP n=1 Tax=Pontivivens ytuae TaxID=2789856 RepID=A0A7S9LVJ7_9RHOB|nr:LysR family transcriptional regulator ArgP [Pontivivens ytuae]QPH55765.1 LysR family transcriptional regulator ArgP [Pontivivens ytuae]